MPCLTSVSYHINVHYDSFSRLNDIPDCRWSGGFKIDRDDSSHVSMRLVSFICLNYCNFIYTG